MKKNIFPVLLLFVSISLYGQVDRYGPEQKITVVQNFPEAVRPGSDFVMEIKINKGNVSGLAKFQQYIPAGMTATAMDNAGADFSFESQNVKFIWTSVPQDAQISIRYKITVAPTLSDKKYLSGTFSYVENDRTKKITLVPKEIHITPTAPVVELAAATTETKSEAEEVPPVKSETSFTPDTGVHGEEKTEPASVSTPAPETTPAVTETQKQPEESAPPVETAVPVPAATENKTVAPDNADAPASSGIIFKVQIAAINEKLSRRKNYFQEKFGLQMEVSTEVHEGLKKYTVGNFASYAGARKFRDEILSNVSDSFVVAYKDGVRIPVPEAIEMLKKK